MITSLRKQEGRGKEKDMKKIIVTGCNGQLGRAINLRYAQNKEYELINTDVEQLDITAIDKVMSYARQVQPYAIINCAAYTAVEACEKEEDLAFRINAIGARNLAIAANETGAKLVHVSTDYVFAGDGTRPYIETDKTGPQGAYGRTKLAGEEFVKEFCDRYFIVRTAWLYGDGKNFVKTMLRLAQTNDKVRVVKDQVGSPTSASELARAIAYLLPTENYGLFHGTCEGDCSWADFAREIFRLAGQKTEVEGITSEEYGAAVKRPACSILENYMLKMTTDFMFQDWHEAIEEYIKSIV